MKHLDRLKSHYEHIFRCNMEFFLYLEKHRDKITRAQAKLLMRNLVDITEAGLQLISENIDDFVDHFISGYDSHTENSKKPSLKVLNFPKKSQGNKKDIKDLH